MAEKQHPSGAAQDFFDKHAGQRHLRVQIVQEGIEWSIFIPRTPVSATGATMDDALAEMVDAVRAHASAWTKRLRFASNHQHGEQLKRVADGFGDADLRRWLLGMQGGVEEEPLTTAGVAERTGLSEAEITQLAREGKLYFRTHEGEQWFPGWQFTMTGILPAVDRVISVMDKTLHPLTVAGFFRTSQPELVIGGGAVSPKVWLASGENPQAVIVLAKYLGCII